MVLNAAAALYVAGRADSIPEGVTLAESVLDSGQALARLERLRAASQDGINRAATA